MDPGRVQGMDTPWPPEDSQGRINGYVKGMLIFDGEHKAAFDPRSELESFPQFVLYLLHHQCLVELLQSFLYKYYYPLSFHL